MGEYTLCENVFHLTSDLAKRQIAVYDELGSLFGEQAVTDQFFARFYRLLRNVHANVITGVEIVDEVLTATKTSTAQI